MGGGSSLVYLIMVLGRGAGKEIEAMYMGPGEKSLAARSG